MTKRYLNISNWPRLSALILSCCALTATAAFTPSITERPLHPEEAYVFSSSELALGRYRAEFIIQPNYYLYQDKLTVIADAGLGIGEVQLLGESELKEDPFFGAQQVYFQYAGVEFSVYNAGQNQGSVRLEYQGCWEGGVCYPVNEHLVNVSAIGVAGKSGGAKASETDFNFNSSQDFSSLLGSANLAWIVALFFVGGLLLAFTPCVLPMVPIVSAMIMGQQGANFRRRLALSSVYVLSMALVFAALGAISGVIGISLQNYLQHPLLIMAFTLLLLYFAGSMFELYELQMPAVWQRWADAKLDKSSKGGLIYAGGLGIISALLVSPCVSAPLAGALLFIAREGDPGLGALALFGLGLGMGAPLLAIGSGFPQLIPKTGNWMLVVKAAFGIMLVLLAVYMLDRIIPDSLALALYGLVLIVSAAYMWQSGQRFIQGIGLVFFVYGLLFTFGALLGGGNPLDPLEKLRAVPINARSADDTSTTSSVNYHASVSSTEQLQQSLSALPSSAKPLLYVTAEWCVSCKELEWFTLSDSRVQSKLGEYTLIKLDVTANTPETRELLRAYQSFGPPTFIFLDSQLQAQPELSIMTYLDADAMLLALSQSTE